MGTGDWFKTIISSKKVKDDKSKQVKGSSAPEKSNGFKWRNRSRRGSINIFSGAITGRKPRGLVLVDDVAATRIQTAFRAHMARKALRRLKGIVRLQILTQGDSIRKQATNTLKNIHAWSRIQNQIRARRVCMVTEGRLKQKKLENQLKLEAKLHDLEVEWCGGSETMEEILARIHQREEAAVKRERAMAYAFTHQWRANSNQNQGLGFYEMGKANWGWSWMERWIAARPWESRLHSQVSSPYKLHNKQPSKNSKNMNQSPTRKTPVATKPPLSNGMGTTMRARRLSYTLEGNIKANEGSVKQEQLMVS